MRHFNIIIFFSAFLLVGCASSKPIFISQNAPVSLKPLVTADFVKVHDNSDRSLSFGDITNAQRVEKLVLFVNSLPQNWSVPWYGPPVGRIYFDFYKGVDVGNFYVGPNFFGRDVWYPDSSIGFYSQPATESQIKQLGEIVGFDVWKSVQTP